MTIAALGPDGHPRPGWPYTTTAPSSWPVFGADGTVYLAQSTQSGDRIIAVGLDGKIKQGWPYRVLGELEWTVCGAGCANVPDAPGIAPDGSIYDNFISGVFLVGADGRSRPGWPYLLPKGTSVPSACRGGTPGCEGFDPLLTSDGRIYLPRLDERYATAHDDILCLMLDGTFCPGWPVRLPAGKFADEFSVDQRRIVHVDLLGNDAGSLGIRRDGTIVD
jgi:hypothetical protein